VLPPTLALVREGPPPGAGRPAGTRLLDQGRAAIRLRHCSRRTENACAGWIRRSILFHQQRHPAAGKNSNRQQRWLATALLDIEPRLRRVKGHQHLPRLATALRRTPAIKQQQSRAAEAA
jgi:hypothetical protein